jgi:hypothetical protein
MQAAMRRYTEEVRHAHGIEVQIRVGLNSGEVVVRAIGGDLRMDYTAVGQTTHLAARMEQLPTPGTIRLTADTLRLAEGYIEVKPLGPVPVKGLEMPVDVYEMVGTGPRRSRLHAATARGLTRFDGAARVRHVHTRLPRCYPCCSCWSGNAGSGSRSDDMTDPVREGAHYHAVGRRGKPDPFLVLQERLDESGPVPVIRGHRVWAPLRQRPPPAQASPEGLPLTGWGGVNKI